MSKKDESVGRLEQFATSRLGDIPMDSPIDNVLHKGHSTARLPTFESFYTNYGGLGRSPKQLSQPYRTLDRIPPFYAYMRNRTLY